jgi:hypothetical protein
LECLDGVSLGPITLEPDAALVHADERQLTGRTPE